MMHNRPSFYRNPRNDSSLLSFSPIQQCVNPHTTRRTTRTILLAPEQHTTTSTTTVQNDKNEFEAYVDTIVLDRIYLESLVSLDICIICQ
jgi:hypothetical protein